MDLPACRALAIIYPALRYSQPDLIKKSGPRYRDKQPAIIEYPDEGEEDQS